MFSLQVSAGKCFKIEVGGNTHIFLNKTIDQSLLSLLGKKLINSQIFRDWISTSVFLPASDWIKSEREAGWLRSSRSFLVLAFSIALPLLKGFPSEELFYVPQPKTSAPSKQHFPPMMGKASSANPGISDIRKKRSKTENLHVIKDPKSKWLVLINMYPFS